MAKRIFAAVLAAVLVLLTLTACSAEKPQNNGETAVQTTVAPSDEIIIPDDNSTFKLCYSQADSLDPFEAVTQNNQILAQLVFEGLFSLDENYKATLNLASGYNYKDSKTLAVDITSGIKFSDGRALTAADVVQSFEEAKDSPYWGGMLQEIEDCNAVSDSEIEFELNTPNSYAQNLLIFPIKSSDSGGDFPIGSGRYYFATEGSETVLKARVTESFKPHLTTLHLENIASNDSVDNAINIGNISFAFRDLSTNSSRKISANKKLVNMNNLVYIGVNNKSGITANASIRKAIALAVDRQSLVKSAYGGFAQVATGVFNPQFELSTTALYERTADINAATQAIAQSGYSNLSLSLLYNAKNADRKACATLIKQQLEEVGFRVSLVGAESDAEYFSLIQHESFSLYLGEVKLPPSMSLKAFFTKNGAAHYGINLDGSNAKDEYYEFIRGGELGAFLLAFSDETPYIPLLYRKGMICFSKAMNGDMQGIQYDCFGNIENWYFVTE